MEATIARRNETVRQRKPPLVIGLTGNIGTGKSTLLRMLVDLGAEGIDADEVAHQVMAPGGAAYAPVVEAFGPEIVTASGAIDRPKLATIVFDDSAALHRLESIVHPVVFAEIRRRLQHAQQPVVVIEAIKLLESDWVRRLTDQIWVVVASETIQRERLIARGVSPAEAKRRLAMQSSPAEKMRQADVVIHNDGTLATLREEVQRAWNRWIVKRGGVTNESSN